MKIPNEAYVKIKSVHNDIVGHGGVETTMSNLAKGCNTLEIHAPSCASVHTTLCYIFTNHSRLPPTHQWLG